METQQRGVEWGETTVGDYYVSTWTVERGVKFGTETEFFTTREDALYAFQTATEEPA